MEQILKEILTVLYEGLARFGAGIGGVWYEDI
jgi:hypothetical protein